jgi:hypothetical protein
MECHLVPVAKRRGSRNGSEKFDGMPGEKIAELFVFDPDFFLVIGVLVTAAGAASFAKATEAKGGGEGAGGFKAVGGGGEDFKGFGFQEITTIPGDLGPDGFAGKNAGNKADFPIQSPDAATAVGNVGDGESVDRVQGSGFRREVRR